MLALPLHWQGRAWWRLLLISDDWPALFERAWRAWRNDKDRPRQLHLLCLTPQAPQARTLTQPELARQCRGLLPGVHRLVFEGGAVQLTLAIGPVQALLREQDLEVDGMVLGDPDALPPLAARSLARCCRRGARLVGPPAGQALRAALVATGFELLPQGQGLQAVFAPRWESRQRRPRRLQTTQPGRCTVIGAGLAGAACAASLARRGWQVTVLDRSGPAGGASGLPVGLMAPHVSPDDGVLSRLSRAGLRATLEQARQHLREGLDWAPSGVLQRRLDAGAQLPPDWPEEGLAWSRDAQELVELPAELRDGSLWHACGAWIRPERLIAAWLGESGIALASGLQAAQVQRSAQGDWQVLDAQGQRLAESPCLILAGGHRTQGLIAPWLPPGARLQSVRGQVSWGLRAPGERLPQVPVNGHGSLVSCGSENGAAWLLGATFDRDDEDSSLRASDHAANLAKLQQLLPDAAASLAPRFASGQVQGWAGVRCTWRDHLPVVGPLSPDLPGLWLCTGFGSRGLSYSALCAELLAAWLHGEPLPLEPRVARLLRAQRLLEPAR